MNLKKGIKKHKMILWLLVFSVAMGFMESAVVVYLRNIYYPHGFSFPLQPINLSVGITEILREASTLIMLVMLGVMNGRTKTEKFGFFIFYFAIWDIFYYVFLKLLLGWPESLLTWDILFLIPVTWVGPVLGPVINSLTMIVLALSIYQFTNISRKTKINTFEWWLFVIGSLIIIISYTMDYVKYMSQELSFFEIFTLSKETQKISSLYIPENFCWMVFILGECTLIMGIANFHHRNKRQLQSLK